MAASREWVSGYPPKRLLRKCSLNPAAALKRTVGINTYENRVSTILSVLGIASKGHVSKAVSDPHIIDLTIVVISTALL
jgi:hypothetical protein